MPTIDATLNSLRDAYYRTGANGNYIQHHANYRAAVNAARVSAGLALIMANQSIFTDVR